MRIQVEIAPGEVVDKTTILEIKLQRIKDPQKLVYIQNEFNILNKSVRKLQNSLEANRRHDDIKVFSRLLESLRVINEKIWNIEDKVRDCELRKDFGSLFVGYARSVYLTNDDRARLKKEINELFNSDIREEKSYTDYTKKDEPKKGEPKKDHVAECNRLVSEHAKRNQK